jgi:hypothetical protein
MGACHALLKNKQRTITYAQNAWLGICPQPSRKGTLVMPAD